MSKPLNGHGEVFWLFWSLASALLTTVSVLLWVRSDKFPSGKHCWGTWVFSQQNQRGGDFALQKTTAEKQVTLLLGSAHSPEVRAKSTAVWMRQGPTGICNGQERAWAASPAAGPVHTTELMDWNSFFSTSWILSERYLWKSPKWRDSAVAIIDLGYSLHLHLYGRKPLQFQIVINEGK